MGIYKVQVGNKAQKNFRRFSIEHAQQVFKKLLSLADNPRPQDYIKLYGGGYRVTAGEYRILYTIDDQAKLVNIYEVVRRNDYHY